MIILFEYRYLLQPKRAINPANYTARLSVEMCVSVLFLTDNECLEALCCRANK